MKDPTPSVILPGRLWQGGTPVDYAWVRQTGIGVVIDVSDANEYPNPKDLEGLEYVKMPLVDAAHLSDLEILHGLIGGVARAFASGKKVLVHCSWGRNRSGLVTALLLREIHNVPGADAMAVVQQRRRRALNNEVFGRYLASLPKPRPSEPSQVIPAL